MSHCERCALALPHDAPDELLWAVRERLLDVQVTE